MAAFVDAFAGFPAVSLLLLVGAIFRRKFRQL